MNQSTDARIQRSSTAIVQAAMIALNKNPDAALKDIAQQAGVGRATLYRLFDSKEHLIEAIVDQCLTTFDAKTEHIETQARSVRNAIELLFAAILPLHHEIQFLMNVNELSIKSPELLQRIQLQQDEMVQLIDSGKREGCVAKNLPTLWVVNLIDGLLYSAWSMQKDHGYTDEQLVELCITSLFNGVEPNKKNCFYN
ncbi:MAG: AcrR family transcriptional regulator [Bermanella sp.]|jgi:AcrR family transcriptional regulator